MRIYITLCALFFIPFTLLSQNRYDVVISEIMADPTPSAGLPGYEWVELTNTSTATINLAGWRIADATGQSGPMPSFLLQPDSMVIICGSTALPTLSPFGKTLSVTSFPSIDNDGELLYIKTAGGKTMHAVSFNTGWYRNDIKKEGGWSLEMIDTHNPCTGIKNWTASTVATGGTPGRANSVKAALPDTEAPLLLRSYTTSPSVVMLVFDEPLDSSAASVVSKYEISGGPAVQQAFAVPPLFKEVMLLTTSPMNAGTVYNVRSGSISDCNGNSSALAGEVRVGIPEDPLAGDFILNEILFNPATNGDDYAEFYNRSKKILDASRIFIAGRSSTGTLVSSKPLSERPFLIFPGDHTVVTTSAAALARQYLVKAPSQILELASLPSFPDDEGTAVAVNFQGQVVDELHYRDSWHFKLLQNTEGVSLERIDPHSVTQDEHNWHSAASTAGYGTPGYANSQYKTENATGATISILPKLFSPDNDGRDDITRIQYSVTETGYVANIIIYDANGRIVRSLVHNGLMALSGYWNWDGLDNTGKKLPVGTYVVFAEFFNLQGKKQHFKQAVVLAGYLR